MMDDFVNSISDSTHDEDKVAFKKLNMAESAIERTLGIP